MRHLTSLRARIARLATTQSAGLASMMPRRWQAQLTIATLVAICGVFAITSYDARQDARREALTSAENLSAAVTQDIARNIEIFDLSLQAVIDGVTDPEVMKVQPNLRRMILFDRSATARYLGNMVVLDASGRPVIDSETDEPAQLDLSDRDYFTAHQAKADLGLYISRPFPCRVGHEWCIALSRRYDDQNGAFAGVAVGTLRLAYLNDLFGRMNLGPGGSLTFVRSDGILLMRKPYDQSKLGQSIAASPNFDRFATERSGQLEVTAQVDGVRRMVIFRHVGDLPLVQIVGVAVDDMFAAWWRKTLILGSTLVALCSIVLWLMSMLNVQLRRRAVAEAALAELAATDKLTGLNNRRSLDDALAAEWRRAERDGKQLALLMLDADNFKSYNDSYGHIAGDEALKRIAGGIAGSLRRPGDLAARYGGEEFAVLLPNTDQQGAYELAETIRKRILAAAEPHAGSPHGIITLSIGVAALHPHANQTGSDLVAAADKALYASKRDGRNLTTMSDAGEVRLAA